MNRKTWKTPELIVLVRNRPEEAVLEVCKGIDIWPVGSPGSGSNRCEDPGENQAGAWCRPIGTT